MRWGDNRGLVIGSLSLGLGLAAILVSSGCIQQGTPIVKLKAEEPIRLEVRVDRDIAAVGDRIIFTLQAVTRQGVDVDLPFDLAVEPGLEIKGVANPEPKKLGADQWVHRRDWALSPTKVGAYIFKPFDVPYRVGKEMKSAKTATVYLDVRTVLKEGDLTGDIKDIKGPAHLPSSFWIIAAVLGALVVLGLLGYFGWRYWKNRPSATPPLLPHQWALQELERLLAAGLLETGKFEEFTQRLSDILRHYVERRFALMAPERTTEEFITEMRTARQFSDQQQELVGKFLQFCDRVKFAKYAPTQTEMSQGVGIVHAFVQETMPAPMPEAQEAEVA